MNLFIDRVELHAALCLALPVDANEYSWWLAHAGLEPYPAVSGAILAELESFLILPVPRLYSENGTKFDAWLLSGAEAIHAGLVGFFSAESMSAIWMNLVALNSAAALVLSGVSRQRVIR